MRQDIDRTVEEQFGMRLDCFIYHHAEVKSLYDYEIADILDVNSALIGRLRKKFGIKKADGFLRRFKGTYGKDALERFREILQKPHASLSDVGRHFGFSRQYASAIYRKIYERCYREAHQRERDATNNNPKEFPRKTKQLKRILEIKGKMESLGFVLRVHRKEYGYFLETNGYKLAVRCASAYRSRGRREYFQVTNLKGAARFDYDFLIVVCMLKKDHAYYVIPRNDVPDNGLSLIPRADSKSKYTRFKEAWRLLIPKGAETPAVKSLKGA